MDETRDDILTTVDFGLRNLMAKDEFRNLGFDNGPKPANGPNGLALSQAQAQGSTGKDKDAKPGELRW